MCLSLRFFSAPSGAAGAWSALNVIGTPPDARSGATASTVGTKLYVWGGSSDSTITPDMGVFDTVTLTWTEIMAVGKTGAVDVPGQRTGHTAVVIGTDIY